MTTPGTPNIPTNIADKGVISKFRLKKLPRKLNRTKVTPPIIALVINLNIIFTGITNTVPII